MEQFELPDGRTVQADPANPEHAAFLKQVGAKPVSSSPVTALLSGMGEGAARLPFLLSDLLNVGLDATKAKLHPEWMNSDWYKSFREAHKGSGWLDAGLGALGTGFFQPKTTADKYVNVLGQGLGGGLAAVGPAATTGATSLIRSTAKTAALPAAVSGGVGAVAGQGAQDAIDPNNPLVGIIASVLAGGATGAALTKSSAPMKALAESAQATTPAEWQAAAANIDKANRVGAKTATLGEMFPGESPLLARTREATAQSGTNALITKMGERESDLQGLTRTALNAVGPANNTNAVANQAADAAQARLAQFDKARTNVYNRRLAGAAQLDPGMVQLLYQGLKARATNAGNEAEKNALDAVAETLMAPNKVTVQVPQQAALGTTSGGFKVMQPQPPVEQQLLVPKTSISDVAIDLKRLKNGLEYNPASASAPVKLDAHALQQAYDYVQNFLLADPAYARAEAGYAKMSRMLNNPAREGALGVMAGRTSAPGMPTPVSRMEALTANQSPQAVTQTLSSLEKGGGDVDAIARALLENRTRTMAGDLQTKLLGGAPGSPAAEQTQALVRSAGSNVAAFNDPVDVIGLLSRIKSAAGSGGMSQTSKQLGTSAITMAMSPFQDAWVRASLAARKANYRQIAQLLANPTKENLALLQKLAESDPSLRFRLGLAGGMSGANFASPNEEK